MDMVQTYKMVSWENGEQIFERANVRRGTRATAGTDNLLKKRCLHEFRSNFFSTRVIHEWNGLPNEVKEAATAKIFKRRYRNHRAGTVTPAWYKEHWREHRWTRHRVRTSSSGSYGDRRRSTDKVKSLHFYDFIEIFSRKIRLWSLNTTINDFCSL